MAAAASSFPNRAQRRATSGLPGAALLKVIELPGLGPALKAILISRSFAAASFAVMADPPGGPRGTKVLPKEMFGRGGLNYLMDGFKDSTADHPAIQKAITDRIQEHRDFVIAAYFEKAGTYFPDGVAAGQ